MVIPAIYLYTLFIEGCFFESQIQVPTFSLCLGYFVQWLWPWGKGFMRIGVGFGHKILG
jgi:hypothetical protein